MIRGFYGSCGSGKTHTMKALVGASLAKGRGPFLVLDLNGEWAGAGGLDAPVRAAGGRYRWTRARDVASAAGALDAGALLVLVQPGREALELPEGASHELRMRPLAPIADELAGLAIEHAGPAILVLPEAHTSAREGYPLPPHLRTIAHRWRHRAVNAGCWFDTQHFADVSKDLERAARYLYLFGNAGHADLRKVRDIGGDALVQAVTEAGRRAARGQPGYHVRVGQLDRSGPFELRRL